jgi:exonuclease III
MRICFWNIRGLVGKGRRRQLKDLIYKQKIDVICLQETENTFFCGRLEEFGWGQRFSWNWTPAKGHSRGTLVGVRQGDLDAEKMGEGEYFSWVKIGNRVDDFLLGGD